MSSGGLINDLTDWKDGRYGSEAEHLAVKRVEFVRDRM
jgi:hypothetical protein